MKGKNDNHEMRAKRAENFRLRGGTNVTVGGDSKFWGWGGQVFMGGTTPGWGRVPPPYWTTLQIKGGENLL